MKSPIAKKIVLLGVPLLMVLFIIGFLISRGSAAQTEQVAEIESLPQVELVTVGLDQLEPEFSVDGAVVAQNSVDLRSESAGQVVSLRVSEQDTVRRGQTIASLESAQQRLSLQQAQAQLSQQQTNLDELLANRNQEASGAFANVVNQQNTLVDSAYRALLNTDLQAYPLDETDTNIGGVPTISGVYNGQEEGQYVIEVYSSGGPAGGSFRISGLEDGVETVNVESPIRLGNSGLFIQFPENFRTNQEWVVSIPNTRSSQFVTAQTAYQNALASREAVLSQSDADDFQIERARSAVTSAQAAVASAEQALADTRITAPFSGVITDLAIDQGQYVSPGQSIGMIEQAGDLQIEAFVPRIYQDLITVNQVATLNSGDQAQVVSVARQADSISGKIKVVLSLDAASNFLTGDRVVINFLLEQLTQTETAVSTDNLTVPLTALKVEGSQPVVYTLDNNSVVRSIPIETGFISAGSIEVLSGIARGESVIADARLINVGDQVEVAR